MRVSFALVCLALAFAGAASAADINVVDMHSKLAAVDPNLAAVSSAKASVSGHYYKDDEYEKYDKYENKYGKYDKYDKYEDKYGKYDKYERKHEDKYYDYKSEYGHDYGYGSEKLTLKLWEIKRGDIRPQPLNPNTFQFSSTVSCKNPKDRKPIHSYDGVIDIPVAEEIVEVPVGVCEWTVTKVEAKEIGEHADIAGSTQVVCTFTEEAERQCKGDFLCEGLSLSAQGLLYHFDQAPADYGYAKKAEKYDKYGKEEEEAEEPEAAAVELDVMLSLINGVNASHKKVEYDNGVLQYFYAVGEPVAETKDAKASYVTEEQEQIVGQYTIVLKSNKH